MNYKLIAVYLLLLALEMPISAGKLPSDSLNLELYITNDHILFSAFKGWLRPQSYKYIENMCVLFTDIPDLHAKNIGIFDNANELYLSSENMYSGLDDFKTGDTVYSFSTLFQHDRKIKIFKANDFTERPIDALQYIAIVLYKIGNKYMNGTKKIDLNIIVNPQVKDSAFINDIDSLSKNIGYNNSIKHADYKEGNEWINRKLKQWELDKNFGQGCLDEKTADYLDSLLSNIK